MYICICIYVYMIYYIQKQVYVVIYLVHSVLIYNIQTCIYLIFGHTMCLGMSWPISMKTLYAVMLENVGQNFCRKLYSLENGVFCQTNMPVKPNIEKWVANKSPIQYISTL